MTAPPHSSSPKPANVLYAEWALWAWTAWTCLFGIAQSWGQVAEIEEAITTQLQGMLTIQASTLIAIIIIGYGIVAITSVWIILKIGAGKKWARTSLAAGFALDAGYTVLSFEPGLLNHLADLPDFGLQICALYLLYTAPGREWFKD